MTEPERDEPVLTPAAPRRTSPPPGEPPPAGGDAFVLERLAGIERLVRTVADRLVALDQRTAEGFQEGASRALVIAEASDARLDHQAQAAAELRAGTLGRLDAMERLLGELAARVDSALPPAAPDDLAPVLGRLDSLAARVDDVVAAAAVAPPPDPGPVLAEVRDELARLVARLAETEASAPLDGLHARLDELDERLEGVADEVRAVRRRLPLRAPSAGKGKT